VTEEQNEVDIEKEIASKKDKGLEQLRIIREAFSPWTLYTLKEIYDACRKHPDFGVTFDCQNPNARIRTLLQRNCLQAKQFANFKGSDVFIRGTTSGLWGLQTQWDELAA
jgi:hypothetical protein